MPRHRRPQIGNVYKPADRLAWSQPFLTSPTVCFPDLSPVILYSTYLPLPTVDSFKMLRQGAGPDAEALSVFAWCQSRKSDEGSIESKNYTVCFVVSLTVPVRHLPSESPAALSPSPTASHELMKCDSRTWKHSETVSDVRKMQCHSR